MIGLAAAALGAGASIWAANSASNTQRQAAEQAAMMQQRGQDQSLAAYREGLGLQRGALETQRGVLDQQRGNYGDAQKNFADSTLQGARTLGETRRDLTPWITSGHGANDLLSSFYGLGADPALGQGALARFAESPDYKFAMQQGIGALDNSAASKGGLLGGNQLRAVTEYGQGLASQNLGNYLNRISGISQQGMTAAGQLGQFSAGEVGRQGTMGMQLGQLGTNLGTGVSSIIGSTAGGVASGAANLGNMLNSSSNNIGNSIMAGGTAAAAGTQGMVQAINGTGGPNGGGLLNNLSYYNQMGQSSYGRGSLGSYTGMNSPLQLGSLY